MTATTDGPAEKFAVLVRTRAHPGCGDVAGCSPAQSAAVTGIPGVIFSGGLDGHLRAYAAEGGKILWDVDTKQDYATVNGVVARGGSLDGLSLLVLALIGMAASLRRAVATRWVRVPKVAATVPECVQSLGRTIPAVSHYSAPMKIPRGEWLDQRRRRGKGPIGKESFRVRTDR